MATRIRINHISDILSEHPTSLPAVGTVFLYRLTDGFWYEKNSSGITKMVGGDLHSKGYFASDVALQSAYPTAEAGDWAIVGSTDTVWVWDTDTETWVDTFKGGFVPYTGATNDVNLGEYSLKTSKVIVNRGYTDAEAEAFEIGTLFYSSDQSEWLLKTSADTYYNMGSEVSPLMKNVDNVGHLNGQPVYVYSGNGKLPAVKLANADTESTSYTIALATQDVPNTGNARGRYCAFGGVNSVPISNIIKTGENSDLWVEDKSLYLATETGKLSITRPTPPNHAVRVGYITDRSGSNISIFVHPDTGYELSESHDVNFFALANKDTMIYRQELGIWENLPDVTQYTKEATGFVDNYEMFFDTVNRKVTINGNPTYLWRNELNYLGATWESEAHQDVYGVYFHHFDGTNYIWTTTPWPFYNVQIVLSIYKQHFKFALREGHQCAMSHEDHEENHKNIGTFNDTFVLPTSGQIINYILNNVTASNRRPDITASCISDETYKTYLDALSSKLYTWYYNVGTGADIERMPVENSEIVALSGNRPYYNQNISGTWQNTLMSNNSYAAIFVMAIPVTSDIVSQKYRYVFIQPQTQSADLATIQALSSKSLDMGDLRNFLTEFVFIGRIIIRYTANNWVLISVERLFETRQAVYVSGGSGGSSTVIHDSSFQGSGTIADPLKSSALKAFIMANYS